MCEEELSKRFDLKGINVYNHDTQNNFTDDIIRVGGNIQIDVEDSLNLLIIEKDELK